MGNMGEILVGNTANNKLIFIILYHDMAFSSKLYRSILMFIILSLFAHIDASYSSNDMLQLEYERDDRDNSKPSVLRNHRLVQLGNRL